MEILKDFKSIPFVEQMGVLTRIGGEKESKYLPELFLFYNELTGDKTVDAMVEHTLRDVLAGNEPECVEKLSSGTAKEKKLCLQIAGKNCFASVVPVLIQMVDQEIDNGVLMAVFIAMADIKDPLFLEMFRAHVHHSDELIAGICIEMIGAYDDTGSVKDLEEIILEAGSDSHYETCTVATAEAIDSLAELANDRSIEILVAHIHHKNPTARRMIQEELVRIGAQAVPFFKTIFLVEDPDIKIMAANILGRIGTRSAGTILVDALDDNLAGNINVRTAVYEAFGSIHSMKGLVCLTDALEKEKELQVLITAVASLDQQANPGVAAKIKGLLTGKSPHGDRLAEAVVGAGAVNIFKLLYPEKEVAEKLVSAALNSNDQEILETFARCLETTAGERAAADRQKILSQQVRKKDIHILAVDDSRPMALFYRRVVSDMSLDVTALQSAKEALDSIDAGNRYNLVITDLNMPGMDGVEFTRTLV